MVLFDLIKQGFVKDFRSQGFYKNIAVKIFTAFMFLYFVAIFLFLGFTLNELLNEANDMLTPLQVFNGAMIYIVFGGVLIRFFLMQLNTFNLQSYQSLPIKRRSLVNYIIFRPVFTLFNYVTLFTVIPFAIKSVMHYYSGGIALQFVFVFILIIWFDTLFSAYLKRQFGSSFIATIVLLMIVAGFGMLEYFKIFSLFNLSQKIFDFTTLHFVGLIVPIIAVIAAYGINLLFFYRNYYPDDFNKKVAKNKITATGNFSFLERYGTVGELIALQLKLILRHKRTKSLLFSAVILLLFGLIYYSNPVYNDKQSMLIFAAIFTTGGLMIIYGQWIISWESSYFDFILTKNIPVKTYMQANYYLLMAFNLITFILTTPYFFYGKNIMLLQLVAFLYNTGVNISLFLYFAPYNSKRIDLNSRGKFNSQGTTYKNFIIVLPILFFPMILMGIASLLGNPNIGLYIMGGMGIIGFAFRNKLIDWSVILFNKRKYKMAVGFRESEI